MATVQHPICAETHNKWTTAKLIVYIHFRGGMFVVSYLRRRGRLLAEAVGDWRPQWRGRRQLGEKAQ